MHSIRVALAQMKPRIGDLEGNVRRILEFIDEAKQKRADLVAFPELATAGYLSQGLFLEVAEAWAKWFTRLLEASRGITVVVGTVEEDHRGFLYNSALVLDDGRLAEGELDRGRKVTSYRKCYLPTYGMFEEARWFAPGKHVPVFNLRRGDRSWRMAVIICEDLWQPLPSRIAALRGAQLICAIASSPKTFQKPEIVEALLRARAIENTVYMAYVNAVGSQDMVNFWGGSSVVDGEGKVIARAGLREQELLVADLDLYALKKLRELNPYLREERRELIEDYMRAYEEA
jgi:predicted amidohydrolase